MFFEILQIVVKVLSCILEAEFGSSGGSGADKKQAVLKTILSDARKRGMVGSEKEAEIAGVGEALGSIVDAVVVIANATGAFPHAAAPSKETTTSPKTGGK